jgi:hypothetical protein
MQEKIRYRKAAIAIFLIVSSVIIFLNCTSNGNQNTKYRTVTKEKNYEDFAGSEKCITCHKAIYDTHIHTAHFRTSAIASAKNIEGSFNAGENTFKYNNGSVVAMEKKADSFYQVAYINGAEKKRQKIDITIGSGTKGQSYATWQKNWLLQMPVTYFTQANQWSNSPGYPNKIAFNRPITSRCLECHSTFAQKIAEDKNELESFDRNQMILGVDCETCHGPAAKHVEFQTQNPNEKKGKFIIDPSMFSRRQKLDMCSLCHGGRLKKSRPSFEFTAGDKLSDFFVTDTSAIDAGSIDVHGNQSGLMARSECFKKSKTLTCITCHNTHENEKGKVALFSQRCVSCHTNESGSDHDGNGVLCKMTKSLGKAIQTNCIDCHMPKMPSMAIAVLLQGETNPTPALIRSHLIKVYPEEAKKILDFIKKN